MGNYVGFRLGFFPNEMDDSDFPLMFIYDVAEVFCWLLSFSFFLCKLISGNNFIFNCIFNIKFGVYFDGSFEEINF